MTHNDDIQGIRRNSSVSFSMKSPRYTSNSQSTGFRSFGGTSKSRDLSRYSQPGTSTSSKPVTKETIRRKKTEILLKKNRQVAGDREEPNLDEMNSVRPHRGFFMQIIIWF